MSVTFTISFSSSAKTLTVKDDGTDFTDVGGTPSSITVYIREENKNEYVYKYSTSDSGDIVAYLNVNVGLVLTPDIFTGGLIDGFYIVEVIVNEGEDDQILSERKVFTITTNITKLVETNALSVNFPPINLLNSLYFSMALQLLELLLTISDSATYTYERENKWRKIFNAIKTGIDEYKY